MINVEKARWLWKELHEFNSKVSLDQVSFMCQWLPSVKFLLGCESCFRKLEYFMRLWPVEYGEGFQTWGICLHDYVNKELGRNLFYPDLTRPLLAAKGIIQ